MKNFLHKQREILTVLAYVGIVSVLVFFVILPLLDRIDRINDQMQEENARHESIENQIKDLPKIQKQYEDLQNNQDLSAVLFEKNEAVQLIERLEKLAEETGNIIDMSIQDTAPVAVDNKKTSSKTKNETEKSLLEDLPNSNYLPIKIIISGDYNSIYKFTKSLELFEYYSDTISIQIIQSEKTKNEKSSSSLSFDAQNPFSAENSEESVEDKARELPLTATLETVFYTRK